MAQKVNTYLPLNSVADHVLHTVVMYDLYMGDDALYEATKEQLQSALDSIDKGNSRTDLFINTATFIACALDYLEYVRKGKVRRA